MTEENEALNTIMQTHQEILDKYGVRQASNYLLSLEKVVSERNFSGIILLSDDALEYNKDKTYGSRIKELHHAIPKCLYPMDRETEMLIEQSVRIYS